MSKPENPFAFPRTLDADEVEFASVQEGMTLRDWFAGRICSAAIVNAAGIGGMSTNERVTMWGLLAEMSYEASDAMLRARTKGTDA